MEGIELLREAAQALAVLDPDTLTDDQLGDTLIEWQRLDARLAASKARLTAAFDARRAYAADGSKTAAAWLARHTNGSPAEMRAQTRLARRLRHMPATQAALAAGEISERHAEVLASLAASPRKPVADAFGGAEAKLLDYAKTLGFDDFVTAVRYWEAIVDEDGVEEQAAADHASRYVHVSETFRGNWALDGQLDPLTGEEVARELRRLELELLKADWAAAKEIHGDATTQDHLARTPAQRRADALREMARRSRWPGEGKEPKPLLVVHLGDESLKRLCELASGTPIAPGQLVPLLGDADIERIVYAGPSRRVVDLGRRSRFFTGALRRAIELRDRRCTEPGCDTPAEDGEIDHVIPFSKGGGTDQANGEAKCDHHNRHKSDRLSPP
jgi:Domain of unknown function (DUF222)/HNH endonuclease